MEANIEGQTVSRAEKAGYFVRKVAWLGRKSAPDRVFSRPDRGTVWMEFKDLGKRATLLQSREHDRMRASGMEVYVVDTLEEALKILWLN